MSAEPGPCLTPQEIDFLLGLFSCETACQAGFADESVPIGGSALCYPNVRREGADGLGVSIGETAFLWRRLLSGLFEKELGLSPAQWLILWALAASGGESLKQRLAASLGIAQEEFDAQLDGLLRQRLVKLLDTATGGPDGVTVCVSDFASMQRIIRLARQLRDDALEGITEDEVAAMHATLLKILDNLRAMSGRLSAPQAPRSAETSS